MPDYHYMNPRLAEIYDLDSGWSADREFYLALAGPESQNILDLGCGTGLICDAYAAKGHSVTGIDPASAMLDVAQNYRSGKRFDLIIMTGHAFQTLHEDHDILAAFAAMRDHLKPEGRIVFESRNLQIDWAKEWDYSMELETPDGAIQESRRFLSMRDGYMDFELSYQFPDETLISSSRLRFLSEKGIQDRLAASGLHVEQVLGDWNGQEFDEDISSEMIFIVRRASFMDASREM